MWFTILLKKINCNKSSGLKNISTLVLKHTLPFHLRHIINLVLNKNTFPDKWKIATVNPPSYKGGDPSYVNNLTPISILPILSKLTEKVMHQQMLKYLLDENILYENQDGFRPKRSTNDRLHKFTNIIYNNLNNNKCTTAVYLDFRKDFDTLNHTILTSKLHHIGFNQNSIDLVKYYLTNRTQCTN